LVRSRPLANSASTPGSRSPATSALSIARPDTPSTSVATESSLMPASSRVLWMRWHSALWAWKGPLAVADCGSCQAAGGAGPPALLLGGCWACCDGRGAQRSAVRRAHADVFDLCRRAGSADLVRAPTPGREAGHQANAGVTRGPP
jgi:hypothetical protein